MAEPLFERARVLSCKRTGSTGWVLAVQRDQPLAEPIEGGQFFMLRTDDPVFPFLNRPFSVHSAGQESRGPELRFVFKVVGEGTRCLSELTEGRELTMVGPLGSPFPRATPETTTLLVAGGVGLPPLHQYLRRNRDLSHAETTVVLYGASSVGELLELEALEGLCADVRTATEDGSHGTRGRVDVVLREAIQEMRGSALRILSCGPDPMMECVAEIAAEHDIPCLVSLETFMACGFGVCNACAVRVAAETPQGFRYARACMEGPVMDASSIHWSAAGGQA